MGNSVLFLLKMLADKMKIIRILEKIVEYAVYGLVFIIPFSKAGIEIFGITAIVGWFILGLAVREAHGTSSDISSSVASFKGRSDRDNDRRSGITLLSWAYDCFGLCPPMTGV